MSMGASTTMTTSVGKSARQKHGGYSQGTGGKSGLTIEEPVQDSIKIKNPMNDAPVKVKKNAIMMQSMDRWNAAGEIFGRKKVSQDLQRSLSSDDAGVRGKFMQAHAHNLITSPAQSDAWTHKSLVVFVIHSAGARQRRLLRHRLIVSFVGSAAPLSA